MSADLPVVKTSGNSWLPMLGVAAAAAGVVAVAQLSRRRRQRVVAHLEHKEDIKSWENEGGNLAPLPATK